MKRKEYVISYGQPIDTSNHGVKKPHKVRWPLKKTNGNITTRNYVLKIGVNKDMIVPGPADSDFEDEIFYWVVESVTPVKFVLFLNEDNRISYYVNPG